MPRKSKRSSNKRSNLKRSKTRKQKIYVMRGCSKNSKSCKNKKNISSLGNKVCPKCGPNCHCGPNCKCPHSCPGTCYLNRRQKGGAGCGSCGCPIAALSTKQMNMFGGNNYPPTLIPPTTVPLNNKPILGVGQNGGSCSSCGQIPVFAQTGGQAGSGSFFKPAAPIPGPITGSAWGAPVNQWPGMNNVGGDRNYLTSYNANNNIVSKDPALQMNMNDAGYKTLNSKVGGYKYGKKTSSVKSPSSVKSHSSARSKSLRGGGLIPQDLVNLGSDFSFNVKSTYNALNGYKAPVDPLPYKGQFPNSLNANRLLI